MHTRLSRSLCCRFYCSRWSLSLLAVSVIFARRCRSVAVSVILAWKHAWKIEREMEGAMRYTTNFNVFMEEHVRHDKFQCLHGGASTLQQISVFHAGARTLQQISMFSWRSTCDTTSFGVSWRSTCVTTHFCVFMTEHGHHDKLHAFMAEHVRYDKIRLCPWGSTRVECFLGGARALRKISVLS